MMRLLILICGIAMTSCSIGQKKNSIINGKDLNLKYEILSKKLLFPNDNINFYSGYLLLEIPKGSSYADIAESIKTIGLKENLCRAKIFTSKDGYLMEIDSIPSRFADYEKSYFAQYDLLLKGLNWRYQFKTTDIIFKGDLPIKFNEN